MVACQSFFQKTLKCWCRTLEELQNMVLIERRRRARVHRDGSDTETDSDVPDIKEEELHAFSLQVLNEHGFSTRTLKDVSVRSPHALSDALKTKRIRIAEQVLNFHVHCREIFMDTHTSLQQRKSTNWPTGIRLMETQHQSKLDMHHCNTDHWEEAFTPSFWHC